MSTDNEDLIHALERLAGFLKMKDGWDSYGATAIDRHHVGIALNILSAAVINDVPIPQFVPTTMGGVQAEWHQGGIEVEISTHLPISADVLLVNKDDETAELTIEADFFPLPPVLLRG